MNSKIVTLTAVAFSVAMAAANAQAALKLEPFVASEQGFGVTSTLITGDKEAVLVNGLFNKSDALRVAANVLDSGKTLTTIFVSYGDPDYYFGLDELHRLFPKAKIVATAETVKHIQQTKLLKQQYWSPKMGVNAPAEIIVPEVITSQRLSVDGEPIEIKGKGKLTYLWVPANKALVGGIAVTSGEHLWTADDAKPGQRVALQKTLQEMKDLQPQVVIPAHMVQGAPMGVQAIDFSLDYLQKYAVAAKQSKNATALIEQMKQAYPGLPGAFSLELGAKVVKGEMQWP